MIRFIFLFAVLGAGLFVGTQFSGQQGYVLISIAHKTIEMSVTTLVIFIVLALAALFTCEFLIKKVIRTSSNTWNWFSIRKMRRSRRYTNEGIIKLLEGDWKGAEKKVTRWASHHDMPLLCYLTAAEAAQAQGNTNKRNHYLELASKQDKSIVAVSFTQAKQAIKENNFAAAANYLQALPASHQENPIALELRKTTYLALAQWQALLDLLPALTKEKLISESESSALYQQANYKLMEQIATKQGYEGLTAHWQHLSRKVKQQPEMINHFVKVLIERNADAEAFTIIKETLKKNPEQDELYPQLTKLTLVDAHPATVLLESLVKKNSNNTNARSALAHYYIQESAWAKAQDQLEITLKDRADIVDYALLAEALYQQGQQQAALDVSRHAFKLLPTDAKQLEPVSTSTL